MKKIKINSNKLKSIKKYIIVDTLFYINILFVFVFISFIGLKFDIDAKIISIIWTTIFFILFYLKLKKTLEKGNNASNNNR
jgi:hypothetical protein